MELVVELPRLYIMIAESHDVSFQRASESAIVNEKKRVGRRSMCRAEEREISRWSVPGGSGISVHFGKMLKSLTNLNK